MSDSKQVYLFREGDAGMKKLLGGKGANLAEMTRINLPVPPGFIVTTEACNNYYSHGETLSEALKGEIARALGELENESGKVLGDKGNPLLLSVRSGAYFSMPGMMDTILNLGLNDTTVETLAAESADRAFALDCYRRLLQMYGDVVLKIEHDFFEKVFEEIRSGLKIPLGQRLSVDGLEALVKRYKGIILEKSGQEFPQDPLQQLYSSIAAVFASWNNQRAITYRNLNGIPHDLGTAVNIQVMVFGNLGDGCGTGVAFTRNPSTGEDKLYGEFLFNAQGEDVVAGIRTPQPFTELAAVFPAIYNEFDGICQTLEKHYQDMQDIEFTFEKEKLYILQTRNGKRTAAAAVKVAVDMVAEGLISKEEALQRVEPVQLEQLLHWGIDPSAALAPIASGLPASPGAAVGKVVFDADVAEERGQAGENVVLVRIETTPDDIHGIVAAQGVLTSRGGMTSHAAVVARGMGKPCVCGCDALKIDLGKRYFQIGDIMVKEGDMISIDGAKGLVYLGEVPLIPPQFSGDFAKLLSWADEVRTLGVRANADNPVDAQKAREFGAAGIGLCRTEHMFMEQDRLPVVQEMILSESETERKAALAKLLPIQQGDFEGILGAMAGHPVTIRLLDPPLHEFLPNFEELLVEVTLLKERGNDPGLLEKKDELLKKLRSLSEFNPMMGLRGCRLGLLYPEIYRMQVRAICQAAAGLIKKGVEALAEIMIPLVGHYNELAKMREIALEEMEAVSKETGVKLDLPVGTMIELPRACVTADQIAPLADFFSFGTNDLTQTTFGYSRDDAEGKFLKDYVDDKILPQNPFAVLDRDGVGKLVAMAVKLGREAKPQLKLGICGEHGGDPNSIEFCHQVGLTYVSCSPFRVPIARLAAAQAVLAGKNVEKKSTA